MKPQYATAHFTNLNGCDQTLTGKLVQFIIMDDPTKELCPCCRGNKEVEIEPGIAVVCPTCNGLGYTVKEGFNNDQVCDSRDSLKR